MSNAACELVSIIEQRGGRFSIEGERLVIEPAQAAAPFVESIRAHKPAIFDVLRNRGWRPTSIDPSEWRESFEFWMNASCMIEPRWFGGLNCLHIDFCDWEHRREARPCPCPRDAFIRLLEDHGFLCGDVNETTLVSALALKADVEAFRHYQTAGVGRAAAA